MTEFELRETKKIIIHDLTKMHIDNFTTMIINNHRDTAMWCNGIVMYIVPTPTTDAIIEALRDGIEEHILSVVWSEFPTYSDHIKGVGGMKVSLTNASSGTFMSDLTQWIKEQQSWAGVNFGHLESK